MSLVKCYSMLQNARVTAFTVFQLLRENQQGGKVTPNMETYETEILFGFWHSIFSLKELNIGFNNYVSSFSSFNFIGNNSCIFL